VALLAEKLRVSNDAPPSIVLALFQPLALLTVT
jgi:hypothetical protein